MKGLYRLDVLALVLLIVGGLNWLTIGIFGWNFVTAIFGAAPALERIIYIVVGLSAIYAAITTPVLIRHQKHTESMPPTRAAGI